MPKLRESDLETLQAVENLSANGREPDAKVKGTLRAMRSRASNQEALRITRIIAKWKGAR